MTRMGRALYDAIREDLEERKEDVIEDEDGTPVNSTVRVVTTRNSEGNTGEDEHGFELPAGTEGSASTTYSKPIPAWVRYQSGSEQVEGGGLEGNQMGTVQVAYDRAGGISQATELDHNGKRLYVHSLTDLHQGGVIMELTVTRTGETA